MRLYHFTSEHHVEGCRRDGLTLGMLPLSLDPPRVAPGFQWLTSNPDTRQAWNTRIAVKYDRCAFRLTVEIPDEREGRLLRWCEEGPDLVGRDQYEGLSSFGDPENWWLYVGNVPPEWFVEIEDMRAVA